MKTAKSSKKTKLTKKQVKNGIFINGIQRVEEVAYRSLKLDMVKRVAFARKPIYITDYGKRLAILMPVYEAKK
jgi:hypothetical protein